MIKHLYQIYTIYIRPDFYLLLPILLLLCQPFQSQGRPDSISLAFRNARSETDRLHAATLIAQRLMPGQIDSAMTLLELSEPLGSMQGGLPKADYLNTRGIYYWYNRDYNQAMTYFRRTLEMPHTEQLMPKIAQAANNLGTLSSMLGEMDSAGLYLRKALEIDTRRGYMDGVMKTKYDLGALALRMDHYELALRHLRDVIGYQESVSDTTRLTYAYTVLGNIFHKLDSNETARLYYWKSAEYARAAGLRQPLVTAYNNLAASYSRSPETFDRFLHVAETGLKLAKESDDFPNLFAILGNYGEAYVMKDRLDSALEYYHRAEALIPDVPRTLMHADLYLRIGRAYQLSNQEVQARKYLELALEKAKEVHSIEIQGSALLGLASLDSAAGNFRSALTYFQQGTLLRDSIMNKETRARISELHIVYESEQKAGAIRILEDRIQINRQYQSLGLIGIGLLALTITLLILGLRKTRIISRQRLALQQLENEKTENALKANREELTGKVLALFKSEELIKQLREEIHKIAQQGGQSNPQGLDFVLKLLKTGDNSKELWAEFENRFNELNNGFISKLVGRFHSLSPAEVRLCAMLRLQLSTKEIADLTSRSPRTIEYTRNKIRKKIGLGPSENLTLYLLKI